jgi:hypothetical protein
MSEEIIIYFDDFCEIKCDCGALIHPKDELNHINGLRHKNKMKEIEFYSKLTKSDLRLIKKLNKILQIRK